MAAYPERDRVRLWSPPCSAGAASGARPEEAVATSGDYRWDGARWVCGIRGKRRAACGSFVETVNYPGLELVVVCHFSVAHDSLLYTSLLLSKLYLIMLLYLDVLCLTGISS